MSKPQLCTYDGATQTDFNYGTASTQEQYMLFPPLTDLFNKPYATNETKSIKPIENNHHIISNRFHYQDMSWLRLDDRSQLKKLIESSRRPSILNTHIRKSLNLEKVLQKSVISSKNSRFPKRCESRIKGIKGISSFRVKLYSINKYDRARCMSVFYRRNNTNSIKDKKSPKIKLEVFNNITHDQCKAVNTFLEIWRNKKLKKNTNEDSQIKKSQTKLITNIQNLKAKCNLLNMDYINNSNY